MSPGKTVAALALALWLARIGPAAMAEPAPPQVAPQIELVDFGVYCQMDTVEREPAPETSLGYINVLSGTPEFQFRQLQVPALLGVSFGVQIRPDIDYPQARMMTWKPGQTTPEVWYTDLHAGALKTRGFTFEFEDEVQPGLWTMEAWAVDDLLYRVEFEVLPPSELPGIGSDCNLLS
ncbi:MAG: DUF3859 domain-containing protein [Paracoccaceae bacterium]